MEERRKSVENQGSYGYGMEEGVRAVDNGGFFVGVAEIVGRRSLHLRWLDFSIAGVRTIKFHSSTSVYITAHDVNAATCHVSCSWSYVIEVSCSE